MFKSFSNLNSALDNVSETSLSQAVMRNRDIQQSIVDIARSISQDYAQAYSQVQWMAYDSQGMPTDQTPSEQNSAADSIVSGMKSRVKSLQSGLMGYEPIVVTKQVPTMQARVFVGEDYRNLELINNNGALAALFHTGYSHLGKTNVQVYANTVNNCTLTYGDGAQLSFPADSRVICGVTVNPINGILSNCVSYRTANGSYSVIIGDGSKLYKFVIQTTVIEGQQLAPVDSYSFPSSWNISGWTVANNIPIPLIYLALLKLGNGGNFTGISAVTMTGNMTQNTWDVVMGKNFPIAETSVSTTFDLAEDSLFEGIDELTQAILDL